MKYLIYFLLLLPVLTQAQTNYYISSSYNGSNGKANGSESRPYANWSQVPTLSAGDNVLFKRGDVFPLTATVAIKQSGTSAKPIFIGAYGTGQKPVLSGFNIPTWNNAGNGLYWTSLSADPNTVLFDGAMRGKGRYPKATYSFLTYESSNNAASTITDNQLSASPSWVGATAVIRVGGIQWQRRTVTAQNDGTLTLNASDSYTNGSGYFFQNHLNACTELGDWMYNESEKRVYMYFGNENPSKHEVKLNGLGDCINTGSQSYITLDNIVVEGATNIGIAIGNNSNYITIQNCEVRYSFQGINSYSASNACNIFNNYVHHCPSKGLSGPMAPTGYLIQGNLLEDIGTIPGAGASGNSSYSAIYYEGGDGFTIRGNRITRCGYHGIRASRGNNILIENNIVESYGWTKDDNGAIIFWTAANDPVFTNRIVRKNIIRDARPEGGIGANNAKRQHGLYTDVHTQNVLLEGNIVVNPYGYGYLNNSAFNNIVLKDNIFYNCQRGGLRYEMRDPTLGDYRNLGITGNVITCAPGTKAVSVLSPSGNFSQSGTFSGNYYQTDASDAFQFQGKDQKAAVSTFAQWKNDSRQEAGSTFDIGQGAKTRLEYNDTTVPKTVRLDRSYRNLKTSEKVSGSITLQPFEGVVLGY